MKPETTYLSTGHIKIKTGQGSVTVKESDWAAIEYQARKGMEDAERTRQSKQLRKSGGAEKTLSLRF